MAWRRKHQYQERNNERKKEIGERNSVASAASSAAENETARKISRKMKWRISEKKSESNRGVAKNIISEIGKMAAANIISAKEERKRNGGENKSAKYQRRK